MSDKVCSKCRLILSKDQFVKDKTEKSGLTSHCKKCRNARQAIWREKNPDKIRAINDARKADRKKYYGCPKRKLKYKEAQLREAFGISLSDYDKMLLDQNGKCAICDRSNTGNSKNKYFSVDHSHMTGKIRGLLCSSCNIGMGALKDDPLILRRAATYIEERS